MAYTDDLRARHAAVMESIDEQWQAVRRDEARQQFNVHAASLARELYDWSVTREGLRTLVRVERATLTVQEADSLVDTYLRLLQTLVGDMATSRPLYFEEA